MATRTTPCRVCGKMFVPCNKTSSVLGAFNYREIACSPECGAEYLRRVQAARQKPSEVVDVVMSTNDEKVDDANLEQKRTRGRRRKLNLIEYGEG